MKLACASGALHREIERGELTQLEFLDLCARELACDGVVLDARHFPRTDDDYLAALKKTLADRGLAIAALSDGDFFGASAERMEADFRIAVALGCPLIAGPLGNEIAGSWSDQLERLGLATVLGKRFNVTLALRNARETFAATTYDCKRVTKETDSAWLRYGPDPLAFDAASDPKSLAAHTVLLWADDTSDEGTVARMLSGFADFRGFVAIDRPAGTARVDDLAQAMRRWRDAQATAWKILDRK